MVCFIHRPEYIRWRKTPIPAPRWSALPKSSLQHRNGAIGDVRLRFPKGICALCQHRQRAEATTSGLPKSSHRHEQRTSACCRSGKHVGQQRTAAFLIRLCTQVNWSHWAWRFRGRPQRSSLNMPTTHQLNTRAQCHPSGMALQRSSLTLNFTSGMLFSDRMLRSSLALARHLRTHRLCLRRLLPLQLPSDHRLALGQLFRDTRSDVRCHYQLDHPRRETGNSTHRRHHRHHDRYRHSVVSRDGYHEKCTLRCPWKGILFRHRRRNGTRRRTGLRKLGMNFYLQIHDWAVSWSFCPPLEIRCISRSDRISPHPDRHKEKQTPLPDTARQEDYAGVTGGGTIFGLFLGVFSLMALELQRKPVIASTLMALTPIMIPRPLSLHL